MALRLRTHWIIWSGLVVFISIGAIISSLSSKRTISSIELTPGASVSIQLFRPFPDLIGLSMEFERPKGHKRPELGQSGHNKDWKQIGFIDYQNPGVPIKLLVRSEGKEGVYEATPAWAYGNAILRTLLPFIDDGNPSRFQWPPEQRLRLGLPAGYSDLVISVQDVGVKLRGERVNIIVEPPISFKFVPNGPYYYVWLFILWPVYALPVLLYGIALLWCSIRKSP